VSRLRHLARLVAGDPNADRVVPPTGFTARLTVLAAAAMAFLAVFALALALAAGRLAASWSDALDQNLTIRVSAPAGEVDAQVEKVLEALRTTPGVDSARRISAAEERRLLEPWLGPDIPVDALPLPALVEVRESGAGVNVENLRLRLAAEAPGATVDDHSRWRRPVVRAASRLRLLGAASLAMIGTAMVAMVALAAHAALAANGRVIRVLRLVGAEDSYIAGAFVRRFTLRAVIGAGVGAGAGALALLFLPTDAAGGLVTDLAPHGAEWLLVVLVPLVAGASAFLATRWAATRMLRGMQA